jgi:hypothetical protein
LLLTSLLGIAGLMTVPAGTEGVPRAAADDKAAAETSGEEV